MTLGFPCTSKFMLLPPPAYITEAFDTAGSGKIIKWIGIEGESLDGTRKKFLWAENLRGINPRRPMRVGDMADYIVRVKLTDASDVLFGPAINVEKSDPATGEIEIDIKRGYYGIYVEESRRPGFNLRLNLAGIPSARDLRMSNPETYQKLFIKACGLVGKITR